MTDELCVVRFPHPGDERGPDPGGGRTRWDSGLSPHRRSFMRAPGTWCDEPGGEIHRGEMTFWGEWEAGSEVSPIPVRVPEGPAWLHRPLFEGPGSAPEGVVPQNTDPFVFGDRFLYTFCRQPRNPGLRRLARGSVILFGSGCSGGFVLDTVLVVADSVDHAREDYLERAVPRTSEVFRAVTLDPMYGWEKTRGGRLYFGATPAEPVGGMFSFVPCLPGSPPGGFARPPLDLPGLVDPALDEALDDPHARHRLRRRGLADGRGSGHRIGPLTRHPPRDPRPVADVSLRGGRDPGDRIDNQR